MKKTLLLLLLVFLQVSVFGQAKIVFETKSIDVGDVDTSKKPLKVEFKFKNEGNEPLVIKKVSSSSSDLDISYPETSIAPGAEAEIVVSGTVQSGHFKKSITVLTTGNIEMTRLYFSGNNTEVILTEPTFVGESVSSWVFNHKGTIKDLPKGIIYDIPIRYRVGPDNKIKDVEFEKKGLPQAIVDDINNFIKKMPIFESGHREKGYFAVSYNHIITNPQDKTKVNVYEDTPVELLNIINHAKRHFQDMKFEMIIWYVIERDGSITNIQTFIKPDIYSNPPVLSACKTFISEIRDEVRKKKVKSSERKTRTEVPLSVSN